MRRAAGSPAAARALAAWLAVCAAACAGAGPYGHSAKYTPTSEEESAAAGARDYDPVMYAREPEAWRKSKVSLYGIVTSRAPGPGGAASLTLGVRRLEPRNLCANAQDEDTCRVTVSERDFGAVHVLAPLRPEDDMGERSVGVGSLVRVVGTFGDEVDPNDGGSVLRASYYRHWPRHYFVTNASAESMRQ